MTALRLLVGGYTADQDGAATGIGLVEVDADGRMSHRGTIVETESPSFLARRGDVVYASAEGAGRLDAFRVAPDAASAEPLARIATGGALPCHVTLTADSALVACYGDGMLARHPLLDDGTPGEPAQVLRPEPGPAAMNRGGAHAHASIVLADGRVLSSDLGTDAVHVHTIGEDGSLQRVGTVRLPAGSGPRHFAQHPTGIVYVITELDNHVVALDENLRPIVSVFLDRADEEYPSEVAVSADGRFVYAAVRGRDTIVVLAAHDGGRRLERIAEVPTRGAWPRHFVLSGRRLYAADQLDHRVAAFDLGENGVPVYSHAVDVPSPSALLAW
ncbi:6-phosphogluconolactonase (cycloisomerase 2 family) [Diaminobutyricimonas aerilata]|uniref:6-phosphogluconolactonase (Cycloisomerase 2 family) n=1 Tax=Diaminobutyricimonas aerilata TaxID=1162967 RepID=A0A2M9CJI2_9MICO|nr:beta-propeller fold lactonase family protein [Diaminobutyricimonas aerilata]PJJ72056.1 6-phosphogluconolactonase (cycloisomerase 2 family) [Diaminobutyricimonas aerilata]